MRIPILNGLTCTLVLVVCTTVSAAANSSRIACGTLDPSATEYYERSVAYLWSQVPGFDAPLITASVNSLRCLKKAAKSGDFNAMAWLGVMHLAGNGVKPDRERGEKLLVKSADSGNAFANFGLAVLHDEGVLLARDSVASRNYMQAAADAQHPHAQWAAGEIHLFGQGVQQNSEKGLRYLEAAVESGQPMAASSLGRVYLSGHPGIEADHKRALQLFSVVAARGGEREKTQLYIAQDLITIEQFDYLDADDSVDQFWDAVKNDRIEVLRFMIELGVVPDERKGTHGSTVLHLAASYNLLEVITLLLDAGAAPDLADEKGRTALDYARRANAQEAAKLLLNARKT